MTTLEWPDQPRGPGPQQEPPAGPFPWGPKQVLAGAAAAAGVLVVVSILVAVLLAALDLPGVVRDIGGPAEKAARVARYGHERAEAIAEGIPIPEPPDIIADVGSMRVAFSVTLLQQVLFVVAAVAVTGVGLRRWIHATGLHWYDLGSIWRPVVGAIVIWISVAIYGIVAQLIGIEILIPESTVPIEVQRDWLTLAVVGVLTIIGAPLSEEFLFRGLIFGGLARWGFWPAAIISGLSFSLLHLDPGSVIPFLIVGVVFSWLFWHRGTLWDSIICHGIFNATSYSLLVLGAVSQ